MKNNHVLSNRLISLDAFRGFTIAAMIIVNDPGSWSHVYGPLLHAEWNGLTPTDYVFPFFLFIVGVSISLAYQKRLDDDSDKKELVKKIIIRSLKIYLLGLFLWLWPKFNFPGIRWVGVLPRIAMVFLPCAILFLYTNWKTQLRLAIGLLVGYWIVMAYIPVPGIGTPDLSVPEKNWAHYLDNLLLPGRLWKHTWDPEGLLSTLPAIGTGIIGMLIGRVIMDTKDIYEKLTKLFFYGFIMLVIGGVWKWFFPLNKNLWSSSYVMVMAGMSTLSLAAFIYIVDFKGYQKWTTLGRVFGANSIAAYVLAGMLTVVFYSDLLWGFSLSQSFMDTTTHLGFAPKFASLLYAIIYMLLIYIPAYYLYKKRIFIKV